MRSSGCHDTVVKLARLRGCGYSRLAMILGSQQRAIRARGMLVLCLHGRWSNVVFVLCGPFRCGWLGDHSAGPAVKAHMVVHGDVVDDGLVHIRVVNHRSVDVHHRRVVREHSAIPASANEPNPSITKSIVNSAVETNVRSPISGMKKISAAAPAPISGRPEQSDGWRHNPRSRHPKISIGAIRPISWRPKVTRTRTDRLSVHRQRWRAYVHGNSDADL